jgi:hypothetical protein
MAVINSNTNYVYSQSSIPSHSYISKTLIAAHRESQTARVHELCFPQRKEARALFSPVVTASLDMNGDYGSAFRNGYTALEIVTNGKDGTPAVIHELGFPSMALYIGSGSYGVHEGLRLQKNSAKINDTAGEKIALSRVIAGKGSLVCGLVGTPARLIYDIDVFHPLASKTVSVANQLLFIGSVAFGIHYAANLCTNIAKAESLRTFLGNINQVMDNPSATEEQNNHACLKALQDKIKDPKQKAAMERLLGEALVREIEHALPHTQASQLVQEVKSVVQKERERAITASVICAFGLAGTILSLVSSGGIVNTVATFIMSCVGALWIIVDIWPFLEAVRAKARGDIAYMIVSTLLFIPAMILGALSELTVGGMQPVLISLGLGLAWISTQAICAYRLKQSATVDIVKEMIEALRKRHFQTAKDLLTYYQTEEKRAEIRKIIQERIRTESDWAELLTCFNSFI